MKAKNSETPPTFHRIAFKMYLLKGFEAEYQRRHEALWPDLELLLKSTGISEYSIFLDETTCHLFGVIKTNDLKALDDLSHHPVMQKLYAYMKDIFFFNDTATTEIYTLSLHTRTYTHT